MSDAHVQASPRFDRGKGSFINIDKLLRFLSHLFRRCFRSPSPRDRADSDDPRSMLGRTGERLAAQELRRRGYKILYRNFRGVRGGEIDLVCRDRRRNVLVFVEVKTRMSDETTVRPSDSVTPAKQQLIAGGALEWLRLLGNPEVAARFDVVEVTVPHCSPGRWRGSRPRIDILENAFPLPDPHIY
jgi:putative endonuclease